MFISKLIATVEVYDPYGIHRVNGIKIVYVLLVLFAVNGLIYIADSYFFFFYVPLTAMTVEAQGQTIRKKYELFIGTILGSVILIYIFNMLFPFPLFFLFFSFVATYMLYKVILRNDHGYLMLLPIILSLVSYSFNYRGGNDGIYVILNHSITIVISAIVITGALILFPLSFYYKIWLKALRSITALCLNNFKSIKAGERAKDDGRHTIQLITFSKMVPKNMPTYSLLKITILIHNVYILSLVGGSMRTPIAIETVQQYIDGLTIFLDALNKEKPCVFTVDEGNGMLKIVTSWNYLCLNS